MPHRVRESNTENGVIIPDSYEIILVCDMAGCLVNIQRHVKGFSDAMLAVRHLKGLLVAVDGWVLVTSKKANAGSMFVCYKHKREI